MTTSTLLSGLRVLDLSQYIPGPFATRQLADLGADVIKIEPPSGDPMRFLMGEVGEQGYSPIYQHLNRGKRILTLNLKDDSDTHTLRELITKADVLLESYRPGVMAKLGFDRDSLNTLNPALIVCSLSGFGQTGPYTHRGGHDLTYCAVSGALSNSGTAEKPVMSFPPVADHAGAMQASNAILAALFKRERTQQGVYLDISLCESALSWQYLNFHEADPARETLLLNGGSASYNIYQTADERFIALAPIEAKFWQNFCEAVGKSEWIKRQHEPLPQTALIAELAELFRTQPLKYWNDLLLPVDCCYEPILLADEVATHPQIQARHMMNGANPAYPAYINNAVVEITETIEEIDHANIPNNWRLQ